MAPAPKPTTATVQVVSRRFTGGTVTARARVAAATPV